MVRLQMSFLYFQAAVAKLPHAEWADGSAMYYWGHSLNFGAPGWLQPLVHPLVSSPLGTALLTWVPLAIEITLAVALLLPQRVRWGLLAAGLGFHASIAVLMGLWSFALAMWGGVLLLCAPLGARLYRRQAGPVDPVEEGGGETAGARHSRTSSTVSSSDIPDSRASATR
jgi:antimicrobial peptide system SdpB family protein